MLPRPAAAISPSFYRRLIEQQFTGLIIRILGLVLLSWALHWHLMPTSQWHAKAADAWLTNPFIVVSIAYCVINVILVFCQIAWVDKRWLFVAGSLSDGMMTAGLLALYPGIALVGFSVSLTALLAMFQGLSGRFILALSLVLGACALVVAHLSGILVDSVPLPIHGVQALIVIFALLAAWRFEKITLGQTHIESDINPISRLPRVKALHTSLHYLLPYHQRNKIPMSLLMIGLVGRVKHPPTMQALVARLLGRIRHSDVLVHMDDDDFVILLCDTPISGASALAKDIGLRFASETTLQLSFAVSSISLDNAAIDPLLIRMRDSLTQAQQQKTDRIIFVTEEKLENKSL